VFFHLLNAAKIGQRRTACLTWWDARTDSSIDLVIQVRL
jgi:hypothetical protein